VANPALSDKALERLAQPAAHDAGFAAPRPMPQPAPDAISPWEPATPTAVMTVGGAVTATGVLLVLLVAAGFVGWNSVDVTDPLNPSIPGWVFIPMIASIGVAIATIVKPIWARITAPLYALGQGVVVGAISRIYNERFDGIVLQAVAATIGVLAIMLFLHATRIIKVTERFRMIVICSTGAIALVYLFDLVLRLFGAEVPFIHDSGAIGILISVAIVIVASLNLSLDFDFIERAAAARAPKTTEWYAAFGLLLTLVWLYLEMLRLLGKLRE
jgi:uncharacterized YccA/Bax inhibitor family protein